MSRNKKPQSPRCVRVLYLSDRHSELLLKIATELRCSNTMAVAISLHYIAGIRSLSESCELKEIEANPTRRVPTYFAPEQSDRLTAKLQNEGLGYTEYVKRVIERMSQRLNANTLNYQHAAFTNHRRKHATKPLMTA